MTQTTTTEHAMSALPPVAAVIIHEVADFDVWRRVFDADEPARRAAGILGHHIHRGADQPNRVTVYLPARSAEGLSAFLASPTLKATVKNAGATSAPTISLVAPTEDLTNKQRALAGVLVRHRVADYAAWKNAFDGHASARAAAGILGHAVNRATDDPSLVVVYLQGERLDALRAFAASPDLKAVMQAAGIIGAPEISFEQSAGWGHYA